tara:strand:+ start:551 stop:748 length:198 start_codon:yes stop_codon:yes gene_type:complete
VKPGDLVKSTKHNNSIGIVMEIFADLNTENPWIRVLFTHPKQTYQWVKQDGLQLIKEGQEKPPNI